MFSRNISPSVLSYGKGGCGIFPHPPCKDRFSFVYFQCSLPGVIHKFSCSGGGCLESYGKMLLNLDGLNRLLFDRIECYGTVFHPGKVDLVQVDAADGAVVHRAEIDHPVAHVGSRGPLRSAGDIGGYLSLGKFDAYRNVETVEDLKGLQHRFEGCRLLRGCLLYTSDAADE